MEKRKHIVILAAGDFPTHPVPLRALREADFVVCCDSAYAKWRWYAVGSADKVASPCPPQGGDEGSGSRHSLEGQGSTSLPLRFPHLPPPLRGDKGGCPQNFVVIGDGDSLTDKDKRELGDRYIHVAEQDYNDLHKAMQWATNNFPLSTFNFQLLGATGRREDHTLGNISYLVTFAEEHPGADIEMLTDYGRFEAFRGQRTFATFPGQQVSIFAADPSVPFSATGLRWPLEGFHARRWWQATLNEALADTFTLCSEGWLIVFQTYEPKV